MHNTIRLIPNMSTNSSRSHSPPGLEGPEIVHHVCPTILFFLSSVFLYELFLYRILEAQIVNMAGIACCVTPINLHHFSS